MPKDIACIVELQKKVESKEVALKKINGNKPNLSKFGNIDKTLECLVVSILWADLLIHFVYLPFTRDVNFFSDI